MFGLSYFTLKNGIKVLHWEDGKRATKLYRTAQRLVADGAIDVCLEFPDGTFKLFYAAS